MARSYWLWRISIDDSLVVCGVVADYVVRLARPIWTQTHMVTCLNTWIAQPRNKWVWLICKSSRVNASGLSRYLSGFCPLSAGGVTKRWALANQNTDGMHYNTYSLQKCFAGSPVLTFSSASALCFNFDQVGWKPDSYILLSCEGILDISKLSDASNLLFFFSSDQYVNTSTPSSSTMMIIPELDNSAFDLESQVWWLAGQSCSCCRCSPEGQLSSV